MDLVQMINLFKSIVPIPEEEIVSVTRLGDKSICIHLTTGCGFVFSIRDESKDWWSLQALGGTKLISKKKERKINHE